MYKLMVVLVRICGSLACIREPAVGNWNTLDGLWGCPSGSKVSCGLIASMGTVKAAILMACGISGFFCNTKLLMAAHTSSLITVPISKASPSGNPFGLPFDIVSTLSLLSACLLPISMMGLQTWADWKKMPIFYFLYDWLLGLLEDALSPVERPHSVTITAAWQHLLCVVILGSGIFLVAAFRLTWLLLVYCYKGKTLRTPSFAPSSLLCM